MPKNDVKEKLTKILLVSDTHGDINRLRRIKEIHKPDYVTLSGDYVYSQAEVLKEVDFLVLGNNDHYVPGSGVTEELIFTINGARFYLTHSHKIITHYFSASNHDAFIDVAQKNDCKYFLYGHTHVFDFTFDRATGIYLLNPGSLTLPRDGRKKSFMLLWIDQDGNYVKHEEHRLD